MQKSKCFSKILNEEYLKSFNKACHMFNMRCKLYIWKFAELSLLMEKLVQGSVLKRKLNLNISAIPLCHTIQLRN